MSEASTRRPQAPGFYRHQLGAWEAIAIHDGSLARDRPAGFVRNADDAAVGAAFAAAGMPRDKLTLTFTVLAIDTGAGIVLIDTGLGEGGPPGTGLVPANLKAAGIAPEDVTTVIISHFHGDHISGLRRKDGAATYPNARLLVPAVEWDYWMDDARMAAAPQAQQGGFAAARAMFPDGAAVGRFAWGEEVLPGITAIPASGHTPGMTAFEIASQGEALLYLADVTNTPLLFARHPEWQAMFDMAPEQAVDTRRRLLDRAAAQSRCVFFFHAPFPGLGTVIRQGEGYEYLPALWKAS